MKKGIIYTLAGVILVGGTFFGYTKYFIPKPVRNLGNIIVVGTGTIRNTIKATGKVYEVKESTLAFMKQGKITYLGKKVGDRVKVGDLIAEVDAKTAKLDVESASVNLANAQNNLNKLLIGSTDVEKIRASNTLFDSKAKLTELSRNYDNLLLEKENTLKTVQNNIVSLNEKVNIAKNEYEYAEKNITTDTTTNNIERDVANGYALIESTFQIIEPSLKSIRDTLLLETKNDPAYGALSENNPSLKIQAENLYEQISIESKAMESTMSEVRSKNTSLTSILSGLIEIKKLIGDINTMTSLAIGELRASKTGPALTSSFMESKIATMESLSTSISGKYSNINSSLANLKNYGNDSLEALADKNTLANKKSTITQITNDFESAKRGLESTKASYESKIISAKEEIESARNSIKLNEASYSEIMAGAESIEIKSARNSIQSASISLEKAKLGLTDYQIRATEDGIIKDIPWSIGDITETNESISIDTSGGFEIQVSLDQSDIIKVQTGMPAKITLDAYANTSFSGVVSSVSNNPIETSNVVSYTAKIALPKNSEKQILASMTATVEIIIAEKENVITIPVSTTKTASGKTFVEVLSGRGQNGQTQKVEVLLGITDMNIVEVLSGVTVGQRISSQTISSNTSISGTGTRTNKSSTTPRFGAGGPPGGF